ncbi:hypothetical protein [Agrobacterium vitis]|uniref:hypothetical protein n=1 Tax=Agrobacterium vitis TaxID=373 RepID=UPI0012E80D3D|nr:hypothetical protein [Agrobacterium vitis]MUZ65047.1 hypothetical protein [Agrobacterium vitis]
MTPTRNLPLSPRVRDSAVVQHQHQESKALIVASRKQARAGLALVGETGTPLQTIVIEAQEINPQVSVL